MSLVVVKLGPPIRSGSVLVMLSVAGIATRPRLTPSTKTVSAEPARWQATRCQAPLATGTLDRTMYARGEPRPPTTHWAAPRVAPICSFHWLSVLATPFCMTFDEPMTSDLLTAMVAPQVKVRVPGLRSASLGASSRPRGQVVAALAHGAGKATYRPVLAATKRTAPRSAVRTVSGRPRPEFSATRPAAV